MLKNLEVSVIMSATFFQVIEREREKQTVNNWYIQVENIKVKKELNAVYFFITSNIYFATTLDSFMLVR